MVSNRRLNPGVTLALAFLLLIVALSQPAWAVGQSDCVALQNALTGCKNSPNFTGCYISGSTHGCANNTQPFAVKGSFIPGAPPNGIPNYPYAQVCCGPCGSKPSIGGPGSRWEDWPEGDVCLNGCKYGPPHGNCEGGVCVTRAGGDAFGALSPKPGNNGMGETCNTAPGGATDPPPDDTPAPPCPPDQICITQDTNGKPQICFNGVCIPALQGAQQPTAASNPPAPAPGTDVSGGPSPQPNNSPTDSTEPPKASVTVNVTIQSPPNPPTTVPVDVRADDEADEVEGPDVDGDGVPVDGDDARSGGGGFQDDPDDNDPTVPGGGGDNGGGGGDTCTGPNCPCTGPNCGGDDGGGGGDDGGDGGDGNCDPTTDPTCDDSAGDALCTTGGPACGGDPIQCAVLLQTWRTQCELGQINDTLEDLTDADGDDDPGDVQEADAVTFDGTETGASWFGQYASAPIHACPTWTLNVLGQTYAFDEQGHLCSFLQIGSVLVVIFAAIASARIFASGV